MSGNRDTQLCCLEGSTPEDREGLFLFIALRWMQRPERVMVGLTENIQACLRIFRRAQHLWLARDILHQPQGVYSVFVLWPAFKGLIRSIRLIRGRKESLSSGVLPFRQRFLVELYPRALPPVTHGSALQAPERMWILML